MAGTAWLGWWMVVAAGAPAAEPASTAVFVTPLAAQGVEAPLAAHATTLVARAFMGRAEYSLLTLEDARGLGSAEATKAMLGCQSDSACVARLSAGLQADLLVTGSVGSVGQVLTLVLTLIDPKSASVKQRLTATAPNRIALADEVPRLVARLMGWSGAEAQQTFKLPKGAPSSVAVLDLAPLGVADAVAGNLTQVLSAEMRRVEGVSVISRDDIRALLQIQQDRMKLGCDDMSCLAEIGGALGVDNLVTGSVGRFSGQFVVSLRLVSVRKVRVENLVTESFTGAEDQLIRAVRRAGRELLGVEHAECGQLAISASEPGADVFLEGVRRGEVPMAPLKDLKPGPYPLHVTKAGYVDWTGDVYVEPGDTTSVWVELVARPTPWFRKWWVWTVMGTTGAAGAAALLLATAASVAVLGASAAVVVSQSRESSGTVTVH